MRVRESEGSARTVIARCRGRCGCEFDGRGDAGRHVGDAGRGAGGERQLGGLAKLKVCGPMTTGQPQAAASIRFWPPSGAKLPPSSATSAQRVVQRHLEHRIAEPDVGSGARPAALVPGAAPRDARSRLTPAAPRPRRSAADGAARRAAAAAVAASAPPRRASSIASSPSRVDAREHDAGGRGRAPGAAAREQRRVGRDVELQVAATTHLARARRAQPRGVGLGLREHGARALSTPAASAPRSARRARAALAQARVREHHRHAARRAAGEQVRPDLGFHQHADARGGSGRGSGARRRACRTAARSARRPSRSSAGRRRARSPCRASAACAAPGRAARSASSSGAAARVSPSETACIQSAPGPTALAIEAEALADALA